MGLYCLLRDPFRGRLTDMVWIPCSSETHRVNTTSSAMLPKLEMIYHDS